MSRLEAIAVGLYYPTPEPIVSAIAQYLVLPRAGTVRLLDPCAGKGRALALLAQELGQHSGFAAVGAGQHAELELYGVEPNLERAQEALDRIPNLLVTSYFTATLSEGGFQLAFVNPPYDSATDADRSPAASTKSERLELRFLRRTTGKLAPDGVLVWIVPQHRLRDAAKHLAEYYRDLACWRFPDTLWRPPAPEADMLPEQAQERPAVSMYAAFSQIVLIGQRRRMAVPADPTTLARIEHWANAGAELTPLPLDGADSRSTERGADPAGPRYLLSAASLPLRYFLAATFDPDAVAAQLGRPGTGVWGERSYHARHWPDLDTSDLGIGQPIAPLRRGHLALLAAAGIANGQELVGTDGRRIVVKGACRKVSVREESREADPATGKVTTTYTETDHFEVALWAIDLDGGEVIHIA